jgi:hypothetical protein
MALIGFWTLIGLSILAIPPKVAIRSPASIESHAAGPPPAQLSRHPTFAHDIAPIVFKHCASCHHSTQPGALCGTNAFPLLS